MTDIETLIFFLIFVALILYYLGGYFYIQYRRERREIIERIARAGEITQSEESTDLLKNIKKPWTKFFQKLGNIVKPRKEGEISHLRKKFLMAGYREEGAIIMFSGVKAFLALLLAIAFLLIRFYSLKTMPSMQTMFFSVLFALIGFYLPNLWLSIRISRRKEKIQLGLPDALDLMVICVEAGTGLDAAINRIGEEMKLTNKILGEEFRILNLELRAGKQRRDALRNLSLRTGLEDVNSLVTLLIQTEQFGTSIGQALRVHSDSMRTKRYQRAEEIAQKMPVKLIFPLILFIFPTLLIIILGPAIISIIKTLTPILATAR